MENKTNIFRRLTNYLKEVRGEMKKISWPRRDDLVKTTVAVLFSSIFFGFYLFLVDFVFSRFIKGVIFRIFQ